MSEIVERPHVVESESATTDHEHNTSGAMPVVVSLVIVGVLALLAFLVLSFAATAVGAYYKSQAGTVPFGYYYEYDGYDDYPYFYNDGGLYSQTW